jgi:hypothetical protein
MDYLNKQHIIYIYAIIILRLHPTPSSVTTARRGRRALQTL